MVIGNGMIAQRFSSYRTNDHYVIFASGVSNSKTQDNTAYEREKLLLTQTIEENKNKTLVYFSTSSIDDPAEKDSRYILHKQMIEKLVSDNARSYYIFRVSNLAGRSDNPNTILNFFYFHIANRINFDLWMNTSRNLIDIDDMFLITDHFLKKGLGQNEVINIANPVSYPVQNIVAAFETALELKANYIPIQKGVPFSIDVSVILPVIHELGIPFNEDYLTSLLKKYYLNK